MLAIEPRSEVACRQVAADGGGRLRRAGAEEADEAGIGAAEIRALSVASVSLKKPRVARLTAASVHADSVPGWPPAAT